MTDLLQSALQPRSVAIIGASDNIHKIGGRPIDYMRRFGYQGSIYPINPSKSSIQGLPCYAGLRDLPEVPELALIAVGADKAVDSVAACADLGVRSAVIIASGFGETGAAGKDMEAHMLQRAQRSGMRLFGPNTQGLANFGSGTIAGFSTMFTEVPPLDGPIGIISQSGGMSAMTYGLLRGQGLGVRHVHATGNEADVTVGEMALAVAHDPDIQLLLLYLENIANPDMLAQAAAYARARDLPIVAVKAGRTQDGQRAASSHTGSLANEDRTVDAFFRQHGIWRAQDPHEQVRAAGAYLKGWRPAGQRLVVISNSGASCVMGADTASDHQLPLAQLAPATQQALGDKLPGFATTDNPIDITAALLSNSGLFGDVLPAIAQDPSADLIFINIPVAGAGYNVAQFAKDTAAFERQTGKPVAVAAWQTNIAEVFKQHGVLTYANEQEAIGVLAQVAKHHQLLQQAAPARPAQAAQSPALLPPHSGPFLSEVQSLDLLAQHGIATVKTLLCTSASEVADAFAELGGQVVIKACSAAIPHKSEHGLVAVNVQDQAHAMALFEQFSAKMQAMGVQADGVIVAAKHKGQHEFMVGAKMDPVFGPVVVLGDGGKYVEALQDCAVLMPPFSVQEAQAALAQLHIAPLLGGVRGEPALDTNALCAIAEQVGALLIAANGRIASLDLNPVMVSANGAVVVDALVECAPGV
ncbi:acetate--CoA ligase family protein [Lampropedia aestuarii]|uniref:Acetate--CoA ligase family protein n=1 Tax=Lampropedia aestuarii TaxID=2562762 RepID=A0A4S5BQL9_9BURK|nr:acetate--CoA ligase family protein [Lampropedia aestuarii]THJ33271.1 acetate--CoA ligase family protein [Lampropedia aestuarii]